MRLRGERHSGKVMFNTHQQVLQLTARLSPAWRCPGPVGFPSFILRALLPQAGHCWTTLHKQSIITCMAQSTPVPLEVEAKLLIPHPSTLSTIARLKHIGPYRLRPRRSAHLYTVYLDTNDFVLARHGIALRLRRNRTRWEAALKWSGTEEGILHTRPERTVRLTRQPAFPYTLPVALQSPEVHELVKDTPLHPILLSDVYRRRFAVSRPQHGVCAELALDRVHLRHPQARHPTIATYSEVEIELEAEGTVQDVRQIAALLQERFALTPATGSKFSRGLYLLYGSGRPPTTPLRSTGEGKAPRGGRSASEASRERATRNAEERGAVQCHAVSSRARPPTPQQ